MSFGPLLSNRLPPPLPSASASSPLSPGVAADCCLVPSFQTPREEGGRFAGSPARFPILHLSNSELRETLCRVPIQFPFSGMSWEKGFASCHVVVESLLRARGRRRCVFVVSSLRLRRCVFVVSLRCCRVALRLHWSVTDLLNKILPATHLIANSGDATARRTICVTP